MKPHSNSHFVTPLPPGHYWNMSSESNPFVLITAVSWYIFRRFKLPFVAISVYQYISQGSSSPFAITVVSWHLCRKSDLPLLTTAVNWYHSMIFNSPFLIIVVSWYLCNDIYHSQPHLSTGTFLRDPI